MTTMTMMTTIMTSNLEAKGELENVK
jgi:hypothetical protein